MDIRTVDTQLAVAPQVRPQDLADIARAGFRSIVCNRPDGEAADQPGFNEIERAAQALGLVARYLPAESGQVTDEQGREFGRLMEELPRPVLAYCRTGTRSITMWALSQAGRLPLPQILQQAATAGFDLKGVVRRIANGGGRTPAETVNASHEVVIVVGGPPAGAAARVVKPDGDASGAC